jgi:hypothetical protein
MTSNPVNNHRKVRYDRPPDDWFVEPSWCVEALADAMHIVPGSYVWDPCCGGGTIPEVFGKRIGHDNVRATDLVDRGFGQFDEAFDFLSFGVPLCIPANGRINIVMNPPFRQAEAFVRKALMVADYSVAIVQQLSFLASKGRHALFLEHPPEQVLVMSRRPSMPPGHLVSEMGDKAFKGGTTDFCWIVWTKPHDRETRMRWLNPEGA